MADIFDKKQEVLDVILTREGREFMAKSKFKPAYYEFYDADIVYEANNNETQNDGEGQNLLTEFPGRNRGILNLPNRKCERADKQYHQCIGTDSKQHPYSSQDGNFSRPRNSCQSAFRKKYGNQFFAAEIINQIK